MVGTLCKKLKTLKKDAVLCLFTTDSLLPLLPEHTSSRSGHVGSMALHTEGLPHGHHMRQSPALNDTSLSARREQLSQRQKAWKEDVVVCGACTRFVPVGFTLCCHTGRCRSLRTDGKRLLLSPRHAHGVGTLDAVSVTDCAWHPRRRYSCSLLFPFRLRNLTRTQNALRLPSN